MRRIQLYLDDDTDHALSAAAAKLGTSRSALMRDALRASFTTHGDYPDDAVDILVGSVDVDPDSDIDSVVYDRDGAAGA